MSVRLLVRADDAGSSWAANVGCIVACSHGIARSVEVMMPCPWVDHAATLLSEHPAIDVGIHLTLTSEWDAIRWRPLTAAPSLVDAHGYFLPLLVPRPGDERPNLRETDWLASDIEAELRAQICHGLDRFPHASHASCHMVRCFSEFDETVGNIVTGLCQEFGLKTDPGSDTLPRFLGYPPHPRDPASRESSFIDQLGTLTDGTHIFIDHPARESPEMAATGHDGYWDVQQDRASCLQVLKSAQVAAAVADLGIELIDYRSL